MKKISSLYRTLAVAALALGGAVGTASASSTVFQVAGTPSKTELASSANPSVVGQTVTFTATVTDDPDDATAGVGTPAGTVDFVEEGTIVCDDVALDLSGQAICERTYSSVATRSVAASYSGDTAYAPSSSAALSQVVQQAGSKTTLSSSDADNQTVSGQSVTYTATVSPVSPGSQPTGGTVTFTDGGANISGCVSKSLSSAQATCATAFKAGTHSVVARYSGTSDYRGSASSAITQAVAKASTHTALTSSDSDNKTVSGQSVTFTARISVVSPASGTPGGTVTFKDGGNTIGGCGAKALSSGVAICSAKLTVGSGTHSITAAYSGDANDLTSVSNAISHTVV
ncbi:MAG TPA: Ig-like domain-containing protein, partial [Actinomycetota bacterium]